MSIYHGFLKLIKKGEQVKCSRSGRYFYWNETVPDGKGGRISKEYNYWVHDQSRTQSTHKEGQGWKMGARFIPPSMSRFIPDDTVDVTSNYSVTINDRILEVDTSLGNVIITLLLATARQVALTVKKVTADINTVTISPTGSRLIL
jgi:hypothetical protein